MKGVPPQQPQSPRPADPVAQMQQWAQRFATQVNANLQHLNRQGLDFRRRIYSLELRQRLADEGRSLRMPLWFQGQFGEDLLLYDILGEKPDGLLIEVGAFDGKNLSVTYAMDSIGWNCLLIEAIPQRFEQCKTNRPHARVVHAALAEPGSPAEVEFTVTDDHWGGMLSYLTTNEQHQQAVNSPNVKQTKIRVPCTTMDELLKDHTGEIAAASIDVEGGEVNLLKGFDLNKHRPRVLLIEDQGQKDPSPVGEYMKTQNYEFMGWLPHSRIYVRKDLKELMSRVSQRG
jgi:FkbM family methyltransferase